MNDGFSCTLLIIRFCLVIDKHEVNSHDGPYSIAFSVTLSNMFPINFHITSFLVNKLSPNNSLLYFPQYYLIKRTLFSLFNTIFIIKRTLFSLFNTISYQKNFIFPFQQVVSIKICHSGVYCHSHFL